MKLLFKGSCFLIFVMFFFPALRSTKSVQKLYKTIGDQLVTIRKEVPKTQQKVYTILDKVNKMYSITKKSLGEKEQLEKELKIKESENMVLQEELLKSKKGFQESEAKLKELYEHYEQQKRSAQQLEEERRKLLTEKQELEKQREKEKQLKKALKDFEQTQGKEQEKGKTHEKDQALDKKKTPSPQDALKNDPALKI